ASLRDFDSELSAVEKTRSAMQQGAPVIVQAALSNHQWMGRADVLRRVETPSKLGTWSYEVYDCKLAQETKGSTILQLSLYSHLVSEIQGELPQFMYVVTPSETFAPEAYNVAEYAAYYRLVRAKLEAALARHAADAAPDAANYPEPNPHCAV